MHTVGRHAVVIGASMAGLLTARVLAEAYDHVTIVERDILPACGEHRRGVGAQRESDPDPAAACVCAAHVLVGLRI